MKSWISTCKNHHTACQLDASANWLPTRLLQISKSDMFNLRLLEAHNHLNIHLEFRAPGAVYYGKIVRKTGNGKL
ncbi:hypothetical protein F4818DRAFT_418709 [Hypoxylon cercidicola]|nr:hypothetical protein F4818DRAFT_418709 [Hypoxylon cercidicola]